MGSFERALFPGAQGCALLRTRKQLVREQAGHVERVQKTLEGANIKLPSVLSKLVGMNGRAIIEALIAGVTDPEKLTALAPGRIECSRDGLCAAVRGRMTPHHRFLLRLHLRPIDALQSAMDEIDREVDANLASFRVAVQLPSPILGVSALSVQVLVYEIGIDMSHFPTADLVS